MVKAEDRYDSLIQFYADRHGLDWRRIKRQIEAESSFNPRAVSPAGAQGLAQFMPTTWIDIWHQHPRFLDKAWRPSPWNAEDAIEACCTYMAHLYGCYDEIPDPDERYRFALAAYNAGRGNVNRMLAEARRACGLSMSFADWDAAGRPRGPWQTWEFASRFLSLVTGNHSRETIGYVDRIMGRGNDAV